MRNTIPLLLIELFIDENAAPRFSAVKELKHRLANCQKAQVMPYHTLFTYKYAALGCNCRLENTPELADDAVALWQQFLE